MQYDSQYDHITAWKCNKCGRVLTTQGGAERHKERCKYVIPVLPGQIGFEDLLVADGGQNENHNT